MDDSTIQKFEALKHSFIVSKLDIRFAEGKQMTGIEEPLQKETRPG